ncbi:GNAT family N-acetyltransferase [Chloroflexota bacterium]
MSYAITQESFDSLDSYWKNPDHCLGWNSVFVLPVWLKTWWQEFSGGTELYLSAVWQGEKIIGLAPLLVREGTASIIGSTDVCDYLDFVVIPGMERVFFITLLDDLSQKGINRLDLEALRPNSTVLTSLLDLAENRGYQVICQVEDISLELDLPDTWEEYLTILNSKQRHEVRRKLRRLSEAGEADYHFIQDSTAIPDAMDTFLEMFVESREDKVKFLTAPMESFFKSLAGNMTEAGLMKLGILELDTLPIAMIMCFEYDNCIYLYNSGYDSQYSSLSPGLLCKVLCIKKSIQEGKRKFDFLKGNETYKYRLGGREVPLSRCQITIEQH